MKKLTASNTPAFSPDEVREACRLAAETLCKHPGEFLYEENRVGQAGDPACICGHIARNLGFPADADVQEITEEIFGMYYFPVFLYYAGSLRFTASCANARELLLRLASSYEEPPVFCED